jgi:hypothetical protein
MRREEWKAKDRAERVEANATFERHFDQLQQGDTSGGVGAGPLVQGGETYSNEAAMAKQRKAAVKRRASKKARRDPAVQQRLDDLAARVPPVQAEGANANADAQPPTPETPPQPLGVTGEQVEGAVDAAKAELKKQKVSGRPPREYGTLLHSELRASAEQQLGRHLAPGTEFYNDRTLAEITGMSAADAQLSVRDWLKAKGQPNPGLPADVLRSPIGSLKPDLVFREPHGATQMIDLTGQLTRPHFAKTVLYTMVLGQR